MKRLSDYKEQNIFDMKTFFNFTPKEGYNLRDKLSELIGNDEFFKYLSHMTGREIRMDLKPAVKKNSKQAMYDYYHGPLMDVAVQAYTDAGYEMMDEVKCDYLLKSECAKGTMTTPEGEQFYLLDKSKMDKDRLSKFISDCIIHLEMNLDVPTDRIPDAEAYKNMVRHGHKFKSVKNFKNNSEF